MPRARTASDSVITRITESGKDIHGEVVDGQKPSMRFPLRSVSNVRYSPKKGDLEMVGKKRECTLTVSTVKTFAQTLRMVTLSKRLVETDDRRVDLNDVMDEYLPAKLRHPEKFLP